MALCLFLCDVMESDQSEIETNVLDVQTVSEILCMLPDACEKINTLENRLVSLESAAKKPSHCFEYVCCGFLGCLMLQYAWTYILIDTEDLFNYFNTATARNIFLLLIYINRHVVLPSLTVFLSKLEPSS